MSQKNSIRLCKSQKMPPNLICMLPLLELTLRDLVKFESYIRATSENEREPIGTNSYGGSRAKAFNDLNLASLILSSGVSRIPEPDVKINADKEGKISLEYLVKTEELPVKDSIREGEKNLFRGAKQILHHINWVQLTTKRIYEFVANAQAEYLVGEDPDKLKPLSQLRIADELGLSPSTISRLVSGKYIRGVFAESIPLISLIVGSTEINRLRAYKIIMDMINNKNYPNSDADAAKLIATKTGISLSRRAISKYRSSLMKSLGKET